MLSTKKQIAILMKAIFIMFSFTCTTYADEFLNTPDDAVYFEITGNGSEAGFFSLIKFIANEDRLPKASLLPGAEPIDAEILYSKLLLLEPVLIFSENSANCEVFQGPYYKLNDIVSHGTEVSFSYLIKTDSHLPKASCKLDFFILGESSPSKTILYFTQR